VGGVVYKGGRTQPPPTQHTLKVIDYLGNQLMI